MKSGVLLGALAVTLAIVACGSSDIQNPTPDIDAIVAAQVDATVSAQATQRSIQYTEVLPTLTPLSSPTPAPTLQPAPEPSPTLAAVVTPTPTPRPTRIPSPTSTPVPPILIGMIWTLEDEQMVVVGVYTYTPAEEAGIQTGDVILAINGLEVKYLRPQDIDSQLEGLPGTPVELLVRHADSMEPEIITIIREIRVLPTPTPLPPTPTPSPTVLSQPTPRPTSFGSGTRIVGSGISPGTYQNSDSSSGCYWARLSGFSGELGDIIANGFDYSVQIVTIASSDAGFSSSGCGIWTRVQ